MRRSENHLFGSSVCMCLSLVRSLDKTQSCCQEAAIYFRHVHTDRELTSSSTNFSSFSMRLFCFWIRSFCSLNLLMMKPSLALSSSSMSRPAKRLFEPIAEDWFEGLDIFDDVKGFWSCFMKVIWKVKFYEFKGFPGLFDKSIIIENASDTREDFCAL